MLSDKRWTAIGTEWADILRQSTLALGGGEPHDWSQALEAARDEYRAIRDDANLYELCLGKQCLSRVATALEFRAAEALEKQVVQLWGTEKVERPPAVVALREYINRLSPSQVGSSVHS